MRWFAGASWPLKPTSFGTTKSLTIRWMLTLDDFAVSNLFNIQIQHILFRHWGTNVKSFGHFIIVNIYIYTYIIHYILYNIIYLHIPQVIAQLQCANHRLVSSVAPWTSARHSQGQGRPHQAWQRDLLSIEIRCFQSWLMSIDYCWWLLLMIADWWWLLMIIADDYWWLVPIDYLVGGFNPSEKY